MKHILIVFPSRGLPSEREVPGDLFIYQDDEICFGPAPILGKADNTTAALHANPTRDPEKAFGDTPLGEFTGILRYEPADRTHSFGDVDATGKIPVIHLAPHPGDSDAWDRQRSEGVMKDMGLALHSGPLDPFGNLRPTDGCGRLKQPDMNAVLAQLAGLPSFPVSIQSKEQHDQEHTA